MRGKKGPDIPKRLIDPPSRPKPVPVPSVIVRVRGAAKPVGLVNIPDSESGSDLVLYMRAAHPDVAARTCDDGYVEFGRIEAIIHPVCDAAVLEATAQTIERSTELNRWIPVQHPERIKQAEGGRFDPDTIRVINIPDSVHGRQLLAEIFRVYGPQNPQDPPLPHEYTLFTSDNGETPVRMLAVANPHLL